MALTIMVSSGERLTSTPSMFITRVMKASQSNLACKKVQINIAFDLIHSFNQRQNYMLMERIQIKFKEIW